ncbi:pyridoxamine 5'-phosphate oxidase family protein [Salegentibacter sp. JZCK2]|uniref:pyridoxamine 5'-phosphate oxidase family protein n=1 Tax=Salegentibacter tibetensis TaxID=2873600 RepID=UPI001CCD6AF3|nr:pyridoxamine 5'-phosphate oxidase family protein [Salegentibacter tibetensis]MBZ9728644.1 pyridoxamine 5'-phosphate oxidase family protein [Salegentibacter tibetensis]
MTSNDNIQLLAENYIGRPGYISKGKPEIIPITYYYDPKENSILSYSGQGSKIEAMRKNPLVTFQVDEITTLENWKSVLLYGKFEELNGIDTKYMLHLFSEGVKKTLKNKGKSCPDSIQNFSSKTENSDTPIIFRIHIDEISGRQRD